jgi:DNA-binding MarR family transcriptional regulator
MEEKGFIYREADKNDKRSVRIMLTKEGRKRKEKARETVLKFNDVVRQEISNQKLAVFFEVLQNINQIVERNNAIYENTNN